MDQYADGSGPIDDTQDAGPTVYNPRLVQLRANHLNELQNPALRSFAVRALLHEGGTRGLASNFEQLSNYANANNMGLQQALRSGFYGPVNNGTIQSGLSPQEAAAGDAAIQSVFSQGRNKIGYRIDQGMQGDPNFNTEQRAQYRPANIDGTFFADHPTLGVGWAQNQLAADKAAGITGQQYEAGGSPVAAINSAAGIKTPVGKGALAFSGDDDSSDDDSGALSADKATGGKGALKTLFEGEEPDKLDTIGSTLANVGAALAGISNPNQANSLRSIAKGIEDNSKSKYQTQVGFDGTVYRKNTDTGEVVAIQGPGATKTNFSPIVDKNTGQVIGAFNHSKGTPTYFNGSNGPASDPDMDPDGLPKSFDLLQQKDPALAKQVLAVNSGAEKLPNASRANKDNLRLRNAVFKYMDSPDENTYNERNGIYRSLTNKSPSQLGGQLTTYGHSGDIMRQLGEDAEALHNSSTRWVNGASASLGNQTALGGQQEYAGKAAAFNQKADGLVGELGKLYNGSQGGGVTEREIMRKNTPRADDPPEVLASKLQALQDLYQSRGREIEQQIRAPFSKSADGGDAVAAKYLPKSAAESMDKTSASILRLHSGAKAPAAPANAAPAQPAVREGATIVNPKTGQRMMLQNGQWTPL